MGSKANTLEQLEQKKQKYLAQQQDIEAQITQLKQDRNNAFLQVFQHVLADVFEPYSLASSDVPGLVGGLIYVLEELHKNSPQKEVWHQAGKKFCKKRTAQKASTSNPKAA